MKRVLFITSHFCSGSDTLFDALSTHPRIEGYHTNSSYESVSDLIKLTNLDHKLSNSSAVYMDELLVNHSIASKTLYHSCNYVFVIRRPREVLNEIVATMGYSFQSALSYYVLRLNRLASISRQARKQALITAEDLEAGIGGDRIASLLSLREPVEILKPQWKSVEDAVPQKVLLECERVYDRTLDVIRSAAVQTSNRCEN